MAITDDAVLNLDVVDKGASTTLDKVGQSADKSAQKMNSAYVSALHSMRSMLASVTYLQSSAVYTFKFMGSIVERLIDNTERLKMSVAANAALITTFASPGQGDLSDVYKRAYEYSDKIQEKFVEINGLTVGNLNQMNLVYREFLKQGVQIDINKQKQLDSFAVITNAIGVLTAGMPNPDIQYGQEIRSVLEGVARQGTTLALVLKSKLGPAWASTIQQWKKDGTIFEKLSEQLKGFEGGASMFAMTWTVVSSTIVSWIQYLMGKGFEPLYTMIITKTKEIDKYLEENKGSILAYLTGISTALAVAFNTVKWDEFITILKDLVRVFGVIIALNIGLNFVNIITRLNGLKLAFGNATLAATIFSKVLMGVGWVGIALLVGTVAKSVWDVSAAWLKASQAAHDYMQIHPVTKDRQRASVEAQSISGILNSTKNNKLPGSYKSLLKGMGYNSKLGITDFTTDLLSGDITLTDKTISSLKTRKDALLKLVSAPAKDVLPMVKTDTSNLKGNKGPTFLEKKQDELTGLNAYITEFQKSGNKDLDMQVNYLKALQDVEITKKEISKGRNLYDFEKKQIEALKKDEIRIARYRADKEEELNITKQYNKDYAANSKQTLSDMEDALQNRIDLAIKNAEFDKGRSLTKDEKKGIAGKLQDELEAFKTLKTELESVASGLSDALTTTFSDMFDSLRYMFGNGTKSLDRLFRDFAESVWKLITDMIAKIMAAFVASGILRFLGAMTGQTWITGLGDTIARPYGFDKGTDYIPNDMYATLHKGESVIPKSYNEAISAGKVTIGRTDETNSLLTTMIGKLDMIGQFAQEKGRIILGDSQLTMFSSVLSKANYNAQAMGVA